MTEKTEKSPVIPTPEGRVSFPSVFTKSEYNGVEKYRITLLIPKDADISRLKADAARAAKGKWGDNLPANLRWPFGDGDTVEWEGHANHWFIRMTTDRKPVVVDKAHQELLNPEDIYGGCYARVGVKAFAYDKMGNKGVGFGFVSVMKTGEGEPFTGAVDTEKIFGPPDTGADDKDNYKEENLDDLMGV